MGRLIKYEIQKIFQNKMMWMLLGLFLVLNIGLVCYEALCPVTDTADFTRKDIVAYYEEYKDKTAETFLEDLEQKLDSTDSALEWKGGTEEELDQWMQAWMTASENEPENVEMYEYIRQRAFEILNYENYLENIQNEKERLAGSTLFSEKNSYSMRNIEKTADQYKKLSGKKLEMSHSYDAELVTDSKCTQVLLVVFAVFLTLFVFLREWENATMALLSPMKYGKGHLFWAKMMATDLMLLIFIAGLYLENYLIGWIMFGIGDLSRPIQTLDGYICSPWNISVGTYLFLFVLVMYLGILAIVSLVAVIGICTKNLVMTCCVMGVVFSVEGLLWFGIDVHSVFSIWHGINYITLLNVSSLFNDFQTMNLFGYPVYMGTLFLMIVGISCILCDVFGNCLWNRASLEKTSFFRGKFRRNSKTEKNYKNTGQKHLFWYEWYKQMIVNKGVCFLACLAVLQVFCYADFTVQNTEADYYYDKYEKQLEGEVYWRTALFLNYEQKYFEQQEYDIEKNAELAEQNKVSFDYVNFLRTQYENEAGKRTGLEMAQEQYEFLDRQQFAGKEVKFLSYKGYRQLFDNERADILDAVKMILVIILGICNLFSYEKNTNVQLLIACAPDGEYRVNKCKCLVSFLYVCMAWAVSFLPRLILIGTGYGYSHLVWSSAGLKWFSYMPTVIPIWIAMVLIQLLRIGGGMLAVAMTAFLSSRVSIVPVTIIISIIILMFPVITYFSGLTGSWGILSLISGHMMIMK